MKKEIQNKGKQSSKSDTFFQVKTENELMKFLIENLPHKNRNNIKSLLSNNQVEVNGKPVSKFNHLLKPGFEVTIKSDRTAGAKSFRGFSIVYEDRHLIVIDKHAGVLSISTEAEKEFTAYSLLSRYVKQDNPENKIFIVHRLDRDTSGLMIFAKNKHIQEKLQKNWNDNITDRTYVAVVEGVVEKNEGVVTSFLHENSAFVVYSNQDPEDGKWAITNYKVLKRSSLYTLLEVNLETGRKNQIRVHMADIGHPIINDKKYGSTQNPLNRLGLHARVLGFIHPETGKNMHFETVIPHKLLSLF